MTLHSQFRSLYWRRIYPLRTKWFWANIYFVLVEKPRFLRMRRQVLERIKQQPNNSHEEQYLNYRLLNYRSDYREGFPDTPDYDQWRVACSEYMKWIPRVTK